MYRLILKEYSENIVKIVILFFISIVLAIAGMFWFAQKCIIDQTFRIFEAYGLTDKLIVFENVFTSEEQVTEDINEILELQSVADVKAYNFDRDYNLLGTIDLNSPDSCGLYLYKLPNDIHNNPYSMVDGRLPNEPNEIMVSSNLNLACGDQVNDLYSRYINGETQILELSDNAVPPLTVVGIFDLNNQIPFKPGWTFKGEYDGAFSGSLSDNIGYAFCMDIIDSDNKLVKSYFPSHNLIVTPEAGVSTEEVINDIRDNLGMTAYNLNSYSKYIEDYNIVQMMVLRSITWIFIVVLITVNISYGVISLSINKKKMGIYYIHGLSWIRTVIFSTFIYLPFVVLGACVGFVIYAQKGSVLMWDLISQNGDCAYIYDSSLVLPVTVMILGTYILINASFCYVSGRKTPADIIRRE